MACCQEHPHAQHAQHYSAEEGTVGRHSFPRKEKHTKTSKRLMMQRNRLWIGVQIDTNTVGTPAFLVQVPVQTRAGTGPSTHERTPTLAYREPVASGLSVGDRQKLLRLGGKVSPRVSSFPLSPLPCRKAIRRASSRSEAILRAGSKCLCSSPRKANMPRPAA